MEKTIQKVFTNQDKTIILFIILINLVLLPSYIAIFTSLIITLFLYLFNGKDLIKQLGIKKFTTKQFKIAFWFGLVASLSFFLIIIPILSFLFQEEIDPYVFDLYLNDFYSYLFFIYGIIWAPIIEEIIFRRFLFEGIYNLINNKIGILISIVISSALFGYLHTEQGVLGQISITGLGILCSIIYLKYNRNIVLCILLHSTYNLVAFTILFTSLNEYYWDILWDLGL